MPETTLIERIGDRWPIVALGLIGVGIALGWAACLAWMKGVLREEFAKVVYRSGTWWLMLGGKRADQGRALDRARDLPH